MGHESTGDQPGFFGSIAKVSDQQHAGVRAAITMDQGSDIVVFCNQQPSFCCSFAKQRFIARILSLFRRVDDIVPRLTHRMYGLRHNVGVGENTHANRRRSSTLRRPRDR